jgi:succinyl-diaminopimelate desuccinylase
MNQELSSKIDAFIEKNREQILADIASLVAIDSVQTAPEENAPFGAGAKAALDKTLELAAGMGLATKNCDNYIGYAELAGAEKDKYLATICHVDVVPAGNGWDGDPFTMRVKDGWLLGRGVSDDKGPMVTTLYALKFLKEEGVALRYPIRAIAGDNEETGMKDVEYYLAHEPAPVFCFTPDAEFPVCNGEKGHFGATFTSPAFGEEGVILEFEGGVANNAVPDRASALVRTDISKLTNAPNITLEPEGDCVRIRGWGKSGHAAMPAGTVNAIALVADYMLANGLGCAAERAYLEALHKLHCSTAGEGLGIACEDGPFGPLTIIGGRMYKQDGRFVQTMDCRFPTTTDGETLENTVRAAVGEAGTLTVGRADAPFYIEADTPAIRACIDTYNEVTGENATPFTMGGGTYARHFPYAVSFGPEHNDMQLPDFGGPMHGANEAAPLDKLLEALKIYILALLRLEEIDF